MIHFDISNDFVAIKYQGRSGPFLHGSLYRASVNMVDRILRSFKQSVGVIAITIKNMVGLVCDPVEKLLEVQCVKRNAKGSTNVIVDTEMALVGTISSIPCYEVIREFDFIQQKSPISISGEMNASFYQFSGGSNPG